MVIIVVDASIIIETLVSGQFVGFTENAIFGDLSPEFSAVTPQFALLEGANVLWKYIGRGLISSEQGFALFEQLIQIPVDIVSIDEVFAQAFEIGTQNRLAIYDSVYIALAQRLNAPLYTLDARQASAARAHGIVVQTPF
ncbi:MAG: type II toxin-antitoxin system VapC family toxin [Pleurocapsa minor GSE-CHR-MK-17-07R]|jgi:predicted nucleic acid-binding protein|nr:type II toxin-antitoxin system VapC family toxin [Pleurocapsa minor GSE-CHR-MK 17-07R]